MPAPSTRALDDEPPPFLGTWRHVYTAVLVYLVALIFALYVFTRVFGNA